MEINDHTSNDIRNNVYACVVSDRDGGLISRKNLYEVWIEFKHDINAQHDPISYYAKKRRPMPKWYLNYADFVDSLRVHSTKSAEP